MVDKKMMEFLFASEQKVLILITKFVEVRYSWLNILDETCFTNHEHKMIYYVLENNKELSEQNLLTMVNNDGIKNNYNVLDFIDSVDDHTFGTYDCEFHLGELMRFKRHRDLMNRVCQIDPYNPTEEKIQELYEDVAAGKEPTETLTAHQLYLFFGNELNNPNESMKPKFTGMTEFDEITGGFVEGVTIISGRAGAGKTSKAMQVMLEFSHKNPELNTIFFSGEIGKRSMAHKIGSYYSKLDISRLKNHLFTESEFIHFSGKSKIASQNAYFIECNGISTFEAMQIMKKLEEKTGRKTGLVCFDYLQIMKPNDKKSRSEAEEISKISSDLRELGKKIPVIAVSNLTKEKDSTECPSAKELKGSSQIEYDASVIYMLWRPDLNLKNQICSCTVKNRFGEPFKNATWNFTGENGTFIFNQWGLPDKGSFGKSSTFKRF